MIALKLPQVHEIRPIDGDTIIAWVDAGHDVRVKRRIRIKGIEGGELGTDQGENAHVVLTCVLAQQVNQAAYLTHSPGSLDKYGRIVSDILFANGQLLTLLLLAEGAHWQWSGKKSDERRSGPPSSPPKSGP